MNHRKSIALNQAFGAVMVLVLVAVLVIVAIYMFSILGSTAFAGSATATTVNETSARANNTNPYTLTNATACSFASPTITAVWQKQDASYNVTVPTTNVTVSSAGVLTNATNQVYTDISVTYSYTWGGEACNAAQTSITNFSGYPALVGLVGTIIFLGLVIGVLVASFVFGRREP